MDKLAQLRQMRESQVQRGTRSLVNPRTLPSAESIKAIADRAEGRATITLPSPRMGKTVIVKAEAMPLTIQPNANERLIYGGGRNQGKTIKMVNASAQSFDKSGFMRLYQRMRRAKTDDERTNAEAALRKAFPNVRPRSPHLAKPTLEPTKSNGLSEVEKKALALAPLKTIKRGFASRKKTKVPKSRSVKSLKRAVNGKSVRKAKARKKKGRR